jgi:DNA-binding PadR family transcriptional regulator
MSLRNALLVSLSKKQGTGYEIANEFDRGAGYFWKASHQQIYKELGKLADDKLVAFKLIQQSDKPPKKIYRLTRDGKKSLVEWLESPADLPVVKEPLLIKLFAGELAAPQKLLDEVQRHIKLNKEVLAQYTSIEKQHFKHPEKLALADQYIYLTLLRGISARKAWNDWAKQVVAFLEKQL